MDRIAHLRASARQCHEAAAQVSNPEAAQHLIKLAADIEQLIGEMERWKRPPPPRPEFQPA
jgi:hypothetical protein